MPQYLISNAESMPKFARLGGGKTRSVAWVDMESATGFATQEEARETFNAACMAMIEKAKEQAKKAVESGAIRKTEHGYTQSEEKRVWRRVHKQDPAEFKSPQWLWEKRNQLDSFPVASRSTADDFLGVFELFFVRSDTGWLARGQLKNSADRLEWTESFALAIPFSSREAAMVEVKRAHGSASIVKTSCVFVGAESVGHANADDTSAQIQAVCEARDIRSAIDQAARERLEAMAAKAAEKEPAQEAVSPRRASRI
jgi:hypothetical protein